jgi:hypothetical protein
VFGFGFVCGLGDLSGEGFARIRTLLRLGDDYGEQHNREMKPETAELPALKLIANPLPGERASQRKRAGFS